LRLFISPDDTTSVWRSGLVPYVGNHTRTEISTLAPAAPRDGGFSYVVAPDGVLFEFTGGPETRDALSHIHFFHEQPLCAANWYVEHLGMELPPLPEGSGPEQPRPPWDPCVVPYGEATWPSLERVGTIRQPVGNVRFAGAAMAWYPRQCVSGRCGSDQPLARSRGQALDHLAFTINDLDATVMRLRAARVTILEEPYRFGTGRAVMIEDPDGLAIELIDLSPGD
jgi:catechol 2,3-dioxygenase-like lactoylglutathione lyase family enzyme